ncbi:lymphatic vessel endothelial hyaluronic acid receptor 1a isoform X2 [Hoplias malabaricus]|uniref:lymphatic vessel endothelial hyaluronic acid receptor 1a isoform X2 n=1 Tax=Hoplias malabaricus TaxID=27720 RepID=UPI0034627ACD
MAKVEMLLLLFSVTFMTPALLIDISKITVNPKHGSIYGVFQASNMGKYAFNASVAREVCDQLGVTIADKMQVLQALSHGFQSCRFGWIDEQIAVILRTEVNQACGQGKVGLIPWRAGLSALFDVFCFNSTDFEAHAQAHTSTSGTSTIPTVQTPKGGILQAKTTESASSAPHSPFSETYHTLNPSFNFPEDNKKVQALGSANPSIGVVPTALLISTILTFLLAAVVAVWYFKISSARLWDRKQQECIETNVWDKCSTKEVRESQTQMENNLENTDGFCVNSDYENDDECKGKSST